MNAKEFLETKAFVKKSAADIVALFTKHREALNAIVGMERLEASRAFTYTAKCSDIVGTYIVREVNRQLEALGWLCKDCVLVRAITQEPVAQQVVFTYVVRGLVLKATPTIAFSTISGAYSVAVNDALADGKLPVISLPGFFCGANVHMTEARLGDVCEELKMLLKEDGWFPVTKYSFTPHNDGTSRWSIEIDLDTEKPHGTRLPKAKLTKNKTQPK